MLLREVIPTKRPPHAKLDLSEYEFHVVGWVSGKVVSE